MPVAAMSAICLLEWHMLGPGERTGQFAVTVESKRNDHCLLGFVKVIQISMSYGNFENKNTSTTIFSVCSHGLRWPRLAPVSPLPGRLWK